jgi:Domain of unknown function (DUF4184)
VPFTFLAHQSFVLPLKIKRPAWFDATALCVGSMAPDLAYPLGSWLGRRSHTLVGLIVWSIPFTVVASVLVRTQVAPTAFAHLPDAGPFRLHSFRALRRRRPCRLVTVVSAALGSGSHVVIDGFTHTGRFVGVGWARAQGGTYAFEMIDATAAAAYVACLLPICRASSNDNRTEHDRVRARDRS